MPTPGCSSPAVATTPSGGPVRPSPGTSTAFRSNRGRRLPGPPNWHPSRPSRCRRSSPVPHPVGQLPGRDGRPARRHRARGGQHDRCPGHRDPASVEVYGIDTRGLRIADGSGMSRNNAVPRRTSRRCSSRSMPGRGRSASSATGCRSPGSPEPSTTPTGSSATTPWRGAMCGRSPGRSRRHTRSPGSSTRPTAPTLIFAIFATGRVGSNARTAHRHPHDDRRSTLREQPLQHVAQVAAGRSQDLGRVRISAPSSVMAMVCSLCAVLRARCTPERPAVGIRDELCGVRHDPGLQREQEAGAQGCTAAGTPGVRNVRVLMHGRSRCRDRRTRH